MIQRQCHFFSQLFGEWLLAGIRHQCQAAGEPQLVYRTQAAGVGCLQGCVTMRSARLVGACVAMQWNENSDEPKMMPCRLR